MVDVLVRICIDVPALVQHDDVGGGGRSEESAAARRSARQNRDAIWQANFIGVGVEERAPVAALALLPVKAHALLPGIAANAASKIAGGAGTAPAAAVLGPLGMLSSGHVLSVLVVAWA